MPMPWDGKHHTRVAGVRHHNGTVPGKKRPIKYQVYPLTGSDHSSNMGVSHATHGIAKGTGCVNHHLRTNLQFLATLQVYSHDSVEESVAVMREARHCHVVQECRALLGRRPDQIDKQPGIVELTIVVNDSTAQAFCFDSWQPLQSFFSR